MKLFYNSQTYTYTPVSRRFICPRAINWRYLVSNKDIESATSATPPQTFVNPQAINWRYQLSGIQ